MQMKNVSYYRLTNIDTYQLGSTSIAGHEALKGSSLRLPKLDGAPRGCINGSIKVQRMQQVFLKRILTFSKRVMRKKKECSNQVNVSRDRHVDIEYFLLVSIGLWREIIYRMDSMFENKDRFQQKHRFVVDDYLCHVAPPFN